MLRAAVNSGYGYGRMTKFRTSTNTVVRCDTNNCRICHARRTEAHINQCFEALCPYHTYSSRAGHTSPLLRSYLGSRSTGARTRQRSSEMVWYGMRQHCCILFSYSLLFTPSSSPGDSASIYPIWTHGTFPPGRARVASDISLRLGIIRSWGASHPARTHRSMHATPCFSLRSVSEWHWPFIEVTPGQAQ